MRGNVFVMRWTRSECASMREILYKPVLLHSWITRQGACLFVFDRRDGRTPPYGRGRTLTGRKPRRSAPDLTVSVANVVREVERKSHSVSYARFTRVKQAQEQAQEMKKVLLSCACACFTNFTVWTGCLRLLHKFHRVNRLLALASQISPCEPVACACFTNFTAWTGCLRLLHKFHRVNRLLALASQISPREPVACACFTNFTAWTGCLRLLHKFHRVNRLLALASQISPCEPVACACFTNFTAWTGCLRLLHKFHRVNRLLALASQISPREPVACACFTNFTVWTGCLRLLHKFHRVNRLLALASQISPCEPVACACFTNFTVWTGCLRFLHKFHRVNRLLAMAFACACFTRVNRALNSFMSLWFTGHVHVICIFPIVCLWAHQTWKCQLLWSKVCNLQWNSRDRINFKIASAIVKRNNGHWLTETWLEWQLRFLPI